MSIICTVTLVIKPERIDEFTKTIADMFLETRKHEGFISIRLLKSDTAENEFALIQEWKTTQHHQDYVAFRDREGDLDKLADLTAGPTAIHYWGASPLASA